MSLTHAILALLSRQPKTGYELFRSAEGSVRFFWPATHQQIYGELSKLEKEKWVSHKEVLQSSKPDKKVYSITKSGLSELGRWIEQESEPGPVKDPLLIKLFVGDLFKAEVLLMDLLRHKEVHRGRHQRFKEIQRQHFLDFPSLPLDRKFQYLTLKRGIEMESAWLKWCKEVEAFLIDENTKRKKR